MKKILKYLLLIAILYIGYLVFTSYPKLNIISGFSAKSVASHLFIDGQKQTITETEDNDLPLMNLANNTVLPDKKQVESAVFGLKKRKAIFTPGIGALLLPEEITKSPNRLIPKRNKIENKLAYPYGNKKQKDTIFEGVDYSRLKKIVQETFTDTKNNLKKTRSVLIVYKDHILAEKYAKGFSKDSKILGWSMAKSITSAVIGILVKQGKVSLEQNHLFPEWEADARKNITLKNLLNMNSGLEWEENYATICDVTKMLFLEPNMTEVQKKKKLTGTPNESWNYSSGTSNLLSGFIRNQFNSQQEYLDFWYAALIDKIGMNSMLIETDYSNHYVGSSYAWANTRDWAKFGLLYLHEGNWNGEQIIDTSWVQFSRTPTPTSNGIYGGHFWLNAGKKYPDVPKDMFSCNGFQGQRVFIIPSKNLVVVRTGLYEEPSFDVNYFLKEIIQSLPN